MFGSKEPERHRGKAKVNSNAANGGGLIFASGGLTPRTHHPGQQNAPHPHVAHNARRQQLENSNNPFDYHYENDTPAVVAEGHSFGGGRRHVDPQHVDISDAAKLAEGRLGKATHPAGQLQARGSLQVGSNAPLGSTAADNHGYTADNNTTNATGGRQRPPSSGGATSIQCSENILRRLLNDPEPMYRQAAKKALEEHYEGDGAIVTAEKQISRHKAARQFAEEQKERRRGAQQQSADNNAAHNGEGGAGGNNNNNPTVNDQSMAAAPVSALLGWGSNHQLGTMSVPLAQSTPFALDTYPAEARGLQGPPPPPAHTSTQRPAYHYQTNFSSIQFQQYKTKQQSEEEARRLATLRAQPAPFTCAPFDSVATSDSAYPSPPPVGVSRGFRDQKYLVHHSPQHNQSRLELDQDTKDLQRAQAARAQHYPNPNHNNNNNNNSFGHATPRDPYASQGSTVICGSAMTGCYDNNSEYNKMINNNNNNNNNNNSVSRVSPYMTAARVEAKCHQREEDALTKQTGKAHHYRASVKKTSLW